MGSPLGTTANAYHPCWGISPEPFPYSLYNENFYPLPRTNFWEGVGLIIFIQNPIFGLYQQIGAWLIINTSKSKKGPKNDNS
jgi:hypothetical protein